LALEDHQTKSTALPMFADLLSIETAKPLAFEPFSYVLDDRGLADTWGASEQEDMSWRVGFRRCWYTIQVDTVGHRRFSGAVETARGGQSSL
jgi:hypothetical protein